MDCQTWRNEDSKTREFKAAMMMMYFIERVNEHYRYDRVASPMYIESQKELAFFNFLNGRMGLV